MDIEVKVTTAAPYVPFSTFETALDKLAALGAIPPKIDHTVFPSMGGIAKGQVISAFKFLKLIDANGIPSPALKELAMNKSGRKAAIRKLITECYPNISESDLAGSSPGQIDHKLSDKTYNITGDTRQKARSFLLKAAAFAEMPISKLLTAKGPRGPRQKRPKPPKPNGGTPADQSHANQNNPPVDPANVRMPIALSPDRVAYVEMPKELPPNDAKKLLAMLALSLDVVVQFPEKDVMP